jgi:hypothetical protein
MKSKKIKPKLLIFGMIWFLLFAGRCKEDDLIYNEYQCEACQDEFYNICLEVSLFDYDARMNFIESKESDSVSLAGGILEAWEDLVPTPQSDLTTFFLEDLFVNNINEKGCKAISWNKINPFSRRLDSLEKFEYLEVQGFDGYLVINHNLVNIGFWICMFDCYGRSNEVNYDSILKTQEYQERIKKGYDGVKPEFELFLEFYDVKNRKVIRRIESKFAYLNIDYSEVERFIDYFESEGIISKSD